jgi:hypothetical protein
MRSRLRCWWEEAVGSEGLDVTGCCLCGVLRCRPDCVANVSWFISTVRERPNARVCVLDVVTSGQEWTVLRSLETEALTGLPRTASRDNYQGRSMARFRSS